MSETSKRVLGVPEPLLRYVSTDTVLTLAREVDASERKLERIRKCLFDGQDWEADCDCSGCSLPVAILAILDDKGET